MLRSSAELQLHSVRPTRDRHELGRRCRCGLRERHTSIVGSPVLLRYATTHTLDGFGKIECLRFPTYLNTKKRFRRKRQFLIRRSAASLRVERVDRSPESLLETHDR